MTLRNRLLIWASFFAVSIFMLWIFRGILLPFVVGLALAYLLNPVVGLVQRVGLNRGFATLIVLSMVTVVIVGALLIIVPMLVQQVIGLVQRLPGYVIDLRELANEWVPALNEWLGAERAQQFEAGLTDMLSNVVGFTAALTATIAQNGLTVINALAIFIITPVVAFYLLLDWEAMMRGIDNLLPRDHRAEIEGILAEIDRSMSGVIRGQGSVVLVLIFYYATALSLTGLNFGLAIGIMAGAFSFVPFVGFLSGFILSVGIALVQFMPDNWVMVIVVVVVFLVGQFLEGNILYPKLVGSSIGINPVWLMFALFAFALLFGFVGLLLAVPLAAITAVLTRYGLRKYKASALYLGSSVVADGDDQARS